MDERKLIKKLKENDASAQEYIIRKYKDFLFNAVFYIARRREIAQDVVEDTFIKAFKKVKQFKGESLFSTWLYRIAINILKNELEKEAARNRLKGKIKDRISTDYPEEDYESNNEKERIIWEGMKYITEIEREIIVLIDIQGMSYKEVSELLDIPAGTVRSRIARAREHLRKEILKRNFFGGKLSKK